MEIFDSKELSNTLGYHVNAHAYYMCFYFCVHNFDIMNAILNKCDLKREI